MKKVQSASIPGKQQHAKRVQALQVKKSIKKDPEPPKNDRRLDRKQTGAQKFADGAVPSPVSNEMLQSRREQLSFWNPVALLVGHQFLVASMIFGVLEANLHWRRSE